MTDAAKMAPIYFNLLLLAAILPITLQRPDILEDFVSDYIPRSTKIRNENKQDKSIKRSEETRNGHTSIFKLLEEDKNESKGKTSMSNSAVPSHSVEKVQLSQKDKKEVKLEPRFGDQDVDDPLLEKHRITNTEGEEDYDDVNDKYFRPYGNFNSHRRNSQSMVATRPTITYEQNVNRHTTTMKTITSRSQKPQQKANFESGSHSYNDRNGKIKHSTPKPQLNHQTPTHHDSRIRSHVTQGMAYSTTSRPQKAHSVTTQNPFFNRPGVKPAVINDRPPFTNRPITQRPSYSGSIPTDADAIKFPEDLDSSSPALINGRDEESMSYDERRRYEDIAERMCDKYKSMETKQVQAIPLLPDPEPVRVNISDCAPRTVPLVVGGKVVSIKDFPHMALLGWPKLQVAGYSWKCGGSLISDRYILTAAHCSNQERDNTVVTGPPRAAQLGSTYLDDPGALVVKISSVTRHPKYKAPKSYYDLALVKLATPVKFSERIKPACLGRPPSAGESIIATGWGRTEFGDQSEELRSVSIPIWGIEECWSALGTSKKLPNGPSADTQICAGERQGGKDTCQGDSGGPAQIRDGCSWRIVGVTSVGRGCGAPHTPGIYAVVNTAFIAANAFANQNFRDQTTLHYNEKPPKTNHVTEGYNRVGMGNFNSGSTNKFQHNFVSDYPFDYGSQSTQRRSNGNEDYNGGYYRY